MIVSQKSLPFKSNWVFLFALLLLPLGIANAEEDKKDWSAERQEFVERIEELTREIQELRYEGEDKWAKHLEGRMAALSELRRSARAQPDTPLAALAEPIAQRWRADLARQLERDAAAGWVAYRAGGIDELDELLGPSAEGDGARQLDGLLGR